MREQIREKTYNILVNDAELNYIHQLRDLDPDGEDPSPERLEKLSAHLPNNRLVAS
jgi:hypothetical protein